MPSAPPSSRASGTRNVEHFITSWFAVFCEHFSHLNSRP